MTNTQNRFDIDYLKETIKGYINLQIETERARTDYNMSDDRFENMLAQEDEYHDWEDYEQEQSEIFYEVTEKALVLLDSIENYVRELFNAITDNSITEPLHLMDNGYIGYATDDYIEVDRAIFSQPTDWNYWKTTALSDTNGTVDYSQELDFKHELEAALNEVIDSYIDSMIDSYR